MPSQSEVGGSSSDVRRLRVRHIGLEDAAARPGGLNRYLDGLLRAERELGIDAEAVVLDGAGSTNEPGLIHSGEMSQNIVRRLVAMSRGALAAPLPDLFDSHFALYSVWPVLGRGRRRPWVVHFQGPWADESATEDGGTINVALKRMVERTVYRRASRIVVLSRSFERLVVERYGVSPSAVRRIPPGVDLERFAPASRAEARRALGLQADVSVIVAVRRLRNRMGLEVAIEAAAKLGTTRHVVLALVGVGPERDRLESLALELGAPVRFVGRVEDEDLADWYRAADVSVVPTVALEGFGLVVLESLAVGTPAVVSDVDGLKDAVAGLDGAVVVAPGDAEALAAGLERVLEGGGPSPAACRRHAELYSWDAVAQQHRSLYEELLGRRRRIVVLGHTAQLSGGELALLRLVPTLVSRADVHVILAEDGPLVGRLEEAGASVEVLTMDEKVRSTSRESLADVKTGVAGGVATLRYVGRLTTRLRHLRPDVVHTNTLKAALYGATAARLARVPTVTWHLRDRIEDDYLPTNVVRVVRRAARLLPDGIIANSETTIDALRAPMVPSCVVPSPLDPSVSAHSMSHEGTVRIGILGRLAPWKGQHLFLAAFAGLARDTDSVAVVIGAPLFGEEDYAEELRELVVTLGIEDRVEWRGFRDDIAGELDRLDILVHASVIPEPFGQVVVEGMAAGLAVVAADEGGPAETITDGVNGVLYKMGDRDALEQQLRELVASADRRATLAAAGVRSAEAYRPEKLGAAMFDFWDDIGRQRG